MRWCMLLVVLACLAPAAAADARSSARASRRVTVVAVQMQTRLEEYRSPAAFAAHVDRLMRQAVRAPGRGPRLVAFPEDVGVGLVVMGDYAAVKTAATWKDAATTLAGLHQAEIQALVTRYHCSPIRALFLVKGARIRQVYTDTFSRMAKQYRVTLVAGSAPLPDKQGNVFNTSYVFGPTGKLIGSQRKVHLIELEGPAGLDLTPAPLAGIRALDTPVGRLGVGICYDLFFADVVDRLVADRSRILVQPTFNPQPWTTEQQEEWRTGLHQAVATHPSVNVGVNPMMVGSLWDVSVEGVSSIVGPPFTPPANGYLARAASPTTEGMISTEVVLPR